MDGNRKLERAIERAESKIVWGEPVDQVQKFLRDQPLAMGQAEIAFKEASRRAGVTIRKAGVFDLVFGLIAIAVTGGAILWMIYGMRLIMLWAIALLGVGLLFGLGKFFTGIAKIFGGARAARMGSDSSTPF